MAYALRHDLSYCLIDGRAIFLDIESDRYFRLGPALESAFLRHTGGKPVDAAGLEALVERRILTTATTAEQRAEAQCPTPSRSMLELPAKARTHGFWTLLEVAAIVVRTRRHLRTQALKTIIDALERSRIQHAVRAPLPQHEEARLLNAAGTFVSARLQVPIETCCLLDSLAMTRFLTKRGFATNIIFGVIDDPFSAHCWVQAGDLVLNDTVGNAMSYTPIRVI
ncbi:hypothetical protein BEN78_04490 [Xanthomonas citri pv. mangiferaeindicae]|nr:hypothetical protein BEN78_04490 [Xanthomonas citri pv. mangiferaeindicae]